MTAAYYNEHDAQKAEWLRANMLMGLIAPGDVDERDIRDVKPDDLRGYEQHHFFAGVGVWSYAARLAGWPDDRPLASASCPCQPFSEADPRSGLADERHLWPAAHHLIRERRFPVVVGEQVASKDGRAWLDLVRADMEGDGYTGGAVVTAAAGFGAPIRSERLYLAWLAEAAGERREGAAEWAEPDRRFGLGLGGQAGGVGAPYRDGRHAASTRDAGSEAGAGREHRLEPNRPCAPRDTGATNGFWRDADWLWCRDGTFRPVEPGTFPLADGAPARMVRLRGYGDAINAAQAAHFVDKRRETVTCPEGREIVVNPDTVADFTALPFGDDSFSLVVFDPPHTFSGANSVMAKKYGRLLPGWREEIIAGFAECFRVLRPGGTLIFKWNEHRVPVKTVLAMTPHRPLFGQQAGRKTHWIVFTK